MEPQSGAPFESAFQSIMPKMKVEDFHYSSNPNSNPIPINNSVHGTAPNIKQIIPNRPLLNPQEYLHGKKYSFENFDPRS